MRTRTRNFEMLWTRTRTRSVRTRTRYFKFFWARTRDQGTRTRTLKNDRVHYTVVCFLKLFQNRKLMQCPYLYVCGKHCHLVLNTNDVTIINSSFYDEIERT